MQGGGDGALEHAELVVDLDAQRLEGPLGRVARAGALHLHRDRLAHELDEAGGHGPGGDIALGDDPLSDAAGEALIAVLAQHASEVLDRVGVQDVSRGHAGRRIHAHVERGVDRIGEAARGLVELHRGDAEVKEDPLHRSDAEIGEHLGHRVVDGVHERDAIRPCGEALPRDLQGGGVAVESDESAGGDGVEDGGAVTAEAEGGVDEDGTGLSESGSKEGNNTVPHHGHVHGTGHRSAPASRDRCGQSHSQAGDDTGTHGQDSTTCCRHRDLACRLHPAPSALVDVENRGHCRPFVVRCAGRCVLRSCPACIPSGQVPPRVGSGGGVRGTGEVVSRTFHAGGGLTRRRWSENSRDHLLADRGERILLAGQVLLPRVGIPDFARRAIADDDDVTIESRVVAQDLRHRHTTLLVRGLVGCSRKEDPQIGAHASV